MDITGRRPEDSGRLSYEMPATDFRYSLDQPHQQRHHIPVSCQLASKLPAIASQSLAILPDWVRRSQPTRLSVPTSTYHLVVCLVGTESAVLVHQTTDGSIRSVTTLATYPRRYGDQPFSVAMAQVWRNGPRRLRKHDDDDDDDPAARSLCNSWASCPVHFCMGLTIVQCYCTACDYCHYWSYKTVMILK